MPHDLIARLQLAASVAADDGTRAVLLDAAAEIITLRQQHDAIGRHVVHDLRRIRGAIFPDHPDAAPTFHAFRKVVR
jgi:hypothetical protein